MISGSCTAALSQEPFSITLFFHNCLGSGKSNFPSGDVVKIGSANFVQGPSGDNDHANPIALIPHPFFIDG